MTMSSYAGFFKNLGLADNVIGYPVRSAGQHIPDQLAGLGRRELAVCTRHDLPTIRPDVGHLLLILNHYHAHFNLAKRHNRAQ